MVVKTCPNGDEAFYNYTPSIAAAVLYSIMFGALTIAHVWRMIRTRQWFMTAFVVGALFECVGFGLRVMGNNDPCKMINFILPLILVLVAPSIFAATIYMTLGRTILAVRGESLSPIRRTWLTKIFVCGDIACFLIQVIGAAMLGGGATDRNMMKMGQNCILAGLGLQIGLFGLFVVVAAVFHTRLVRSPTDRSLRPEIRWLEMLYTLYGMSLLIMARNIFRVIEEAMGETGYLLSNEWTLYVFDATLMLAVVAILWWYYPTLIRPDERLLTDHLEAQPVLGGLQSNAYKNLASEPPAPFRQDY